nr:MAG TPA: hypothetical protein [Bacteriophage sp.]
MIRSPLPSILNIISVGLRPKPYRGVLGGLDNHII